MTVTHLMGNGLLALRNKLLIFVALPGGDGEPGLGKPLSSKPGPAELENVRISHLVLFMSNYYSKRENLN